MEHDIIERIVIVETKQDTMADDIAEIKVCVKNLETMANRGSGGLSAILWVGGFATGLVGIIATVAGFIWGTK